MSVLLETINWQDKKPDCTSCENATLLAKGRCKPMLACVHNPDDSVRLAIARYLPEPQLVLLRHDADWRVRYEVAKRIDDDYLREMAQDEETMVQEMALMRLVENSMYGSEAWRRSHEDN